MRPPGSMKYPDTPVAAGAGADAAEGPARLRLSPSLSRLPAADATARSASSPAALPASSSAGASATSAPAAPAAAPVTARNPAPPALSSPPLSADASPSAPIRPPSASAEPQAATGPITQVRDLVQSAPLLPVTLALGGVAALASLGWLIERRRNRHEQDSILWAGIQTSNPVTPVNSSIVTRVPTLDDILPDSPNPAESARAIYVTAIGETTSRREATLIDLHQLDKKLRRRIDRGDKNAAVLLLQQHLVDFRYTSPWVFLELRELYLELDLQKEWDVARDAFRDRFGQNAPQWGAPSSADATLLDDPQLCAGLTAQWPYRPARMWILRWMLGEHDMRVKAMGPPQLPLGVYRDLMTVDRLLDDVMMASSAYHDTIQS
jgi:hypothetical protein